MVTKIQQEQLRKECKQLFEYESTKEWFKGLQLANQANNKEFTEDNFGARLRLLKDYVEFTKMNPDDLLAEANRDIWEAHARIMGFFTWLQGKDDKGEDLPEGVGKRLTLNSASTTARLTRGFYTHNRLTFPKGCKVPRREGSKVQQRDDKVVIFGYDEDSNKITYNSELLQHFFTNLSFRDQTIAVGLISTGADAADLMTLNVGFTKDHIGEIRKDKRFLWRGNRQKDGEPFKVYFSEEATNFLRRYVEQERSKADNEDPLFIDDDGTRLNAHAVGVAFRKASKKMGYTEKGLSHPFRPKRFRHLFRNACSAAGIDRGFTRSFMGHASDTSDYYLEKNNGLTLQAYVQVEPFVTVFAAGKTELSKELQEAKDERLELFQKVAKLEAENEELEKYKSLIIKSLAAMEGALKYYHSMIDQAEAGLNLDEKIRQARKLDLEDVSKALQELRES